MEQGTGNLYHCILSGVILNAMNHNLHSQDCAAFKSVEHLYVKCTHKESLFASVCDDFHISSVSSSVLLHVACDIF